MTLARTFHILALAHSWRGVAESFNFNKWCLKIKSPRHCTEHFSRIFWELSWFYQHLESLLCKISVILSTFIYYIYFIKQFVPTIKSIFRIYLAVVALLFPDLDLDPSSQSLYYVDTCTLPLFADAWDGNQEKQQISKIVHLENCQLNGMVYSNTFSVCLNFAPDKQKQNKDMTICIYGDGDLKCRQQQQQPSPAAAAVLHASLIICHCMLSAESREQDTTRPKYVTWFFQASATHRLIKLCRYYLV